MDYGALQCQAQLQLLSISDEAEIPRVHLWAGWDEATCKSGKENAIRPLHEVRIRRKKAECRDSALMRRAECSAIRSELQRKINRMLQYRDMLKHVDPEIIFVKKGEGQRKVEVKNNALSFNLHQGQRFSQGLRPPRRPQTDDFACFYERIEAESGAANRFRKQSLSQNSKRLSSLCRWQEGRASRRVLSKCFVIRRREQSEQRRRK